MSDLSADLIRLTTPRLTRYVIPGRHGITVKQAAFLLCDAVREVLFGGSAGGGKSWAMLAAALQYVDVPGYAALILRKTYKDLSQAGGIMERAVDLLAGTDARWVAADHKFFFPSGATLSFGHLESATSHTNYQGGEYQFIGFDEASQIPERQLLYLQSRLRRAEHVDAPLRLRYASNPGGVSHTFLKARFLDAPIPGERIYLPSRLSDNPYLDAAEYTRGLMHLDPVTRAQLLDGDWTARATGIFRREWFDLVEAPPPNAFGHVRAWDFAASADGKRTAGVRWCRDHEGYFYVEHVVKGRWLPAERDAVIVQTAQLDGRLVRILLEQEPGSGGIAQIDTLTRMLAGYSVEPVKPTGDKAVRAAPFSSMAGGPGRRVRLIRGPWNAEFLDELELFPPASDDVPCDQVDAAAHGFVWCAASVARDWSRSKRVATGEPEGPFAGLAPARAPAAGLFDGLR